MVAFCIVTLSLYHIFLDSKSVEQKKVVTVYKKEIKKRNALQQQYLEALHNKTLTAEAFYIQTTDLLKNSKLRVQQLNQQKKQLAHQHAFRGRSSLQFWLFVFGIVVALLFFAIKSLYDDIYKGSTYKFQFVSISGIVVGFFWLIHLIFLTQKDFTQKNYIAVLLCCAILCSIFTYFLVKHYSYKDDIILKQLSLLERIKTIHYPKIAIKALYAEKYGSSITSVEELETAAKDFQDDLLNVVQKI